MEKFLVDYFAQMGIVLDDEKKNKLLKYYEMLVEKNKVMNLTAITEFEEVVIKHFADSISIIKAVDLSLIGTVIDIGTGAGFPGMVLKIVFPELNITLLDSLNKRINFLSEVIEALNLDGIKTIHGRAEDFAHKKEYREKFDLCVSRAVANLSTLSEYCMPFVKEKGNFISYKAGDCSEEISEAKNAIKTLGGSIKDTIDFVMPDTDIKRTFVVINKEKPTNIRFPRKAGVPSKEPLK